jgi:hypothetical protein
LDGLLLQTFVNPERDQLFGRDAMFVGYDRILISGHESTVDQAGVAFLFDLQGTLLQTFSNPEPEPKEAFGSSVAFAGGRILIGANQDNRIPGQHVFSGAIHIFDLQGNLITSIHDPEPAPGNWFGFSAASVGENHFVIGSIFNDSWAFEGGEAYLVDLDGNIVYTFESPEPGVQHHFGRSFGLLDDMILIGENFNDGGLPDGKGAVWMFAPIDLGDFNADGPVDLADLDLLCTEVSTGDGPLVFDLTDDGSVNGDDVSRFLELTDRLPGDADFDGSVQFPDFVTLADSFGQAGTWSNGDFDCTGDVQFADFVILADNFGQVAAASVPEPSSLAHIFLAAICLSCLFPRYQLVS